MKLCLAAFENHPKVIALLRAKCWFFLASYLNIESLKQEDLEKVVSAKKFFILDSGAHTFQKEGKEADYDEFVARYGQYVKRNPWIDEYAELDIETKVGLKQVEKWRDKLTETVGRPPIVVWHRERGKEYYKYMVRKYPYVGFSGFVTTNGQPEVPNEYIGWFIREAHDNGAKIHGFGFTRPKLLPKYPFDSVDSSSWTAGSRFGVLYSTNGLQLIVSKQGKKEGVGFHHNTRDKTNAKAWVEFQKNLYEYWGGSQTPAK